MREARGDASDPTGRDFTNSVWWLLASLVTVSGVLRVVGLAVEPSLGYARGLAGSLLLTPAAITMLRRGSFGRRRALTLAAPRG